MFKKIIRSHLKNAPREKSFKKDTSFALYKFTQNKPASGSFWAISVTVNTVNKMLTASKIRLF